MPAMNAVGYLFLLIISAFTGDSQVLTLDGEIRRGTLIGSDDQGKLLLQMEKGRLALPLSQVFEIRFPGPSHGAAVRPPCGLLLVQGDYLAGTVTGGDADRLLFDHHYLGRLAIPIDSMRLFLPGQPAIPSSFLPYARQALDAQDDMVFRKGEGSVNEDFISGTLDLFSPDRITFDCDLGQIEFGYDQLNAVVITAAGSESVEPEAADGAAFRAVVLLRGGSGRLSGLFNGIRNKRLVLGDSFRETVSVPLAAVDSVVLIHERTVFLSDLDPADVSETPFLGRPDDFLYPYRRDRSVTGRELSAAGMRFSRGLGVHSRTLLTYDLKGRYEAFHAFAGISDEVEELRARGSMIFRVRVDGKKVLESPVLRGGDPPFHFPLLSLKGAASLTLEADFADAFDTGDRGFWGHALLTR